MLIMGLSVLVLAQLPDRPLAPWGSNHHPTDVPRRHVEQIAAGRHAYTVRQGGTMDGTNCRSPVGVGMMDGPAIEQTWESNRAVRLENVGRNRRRQPLAVQRPELVPHSRRDRVLGRRPGHDGSRESVRPLVSGDSPPLSLVRRQQRTGRPGQGLQCLRAQYLRERLHLPGRPLETGGAEGDARPGSWATASRRPSSTAAGTCSTATCTRCTCCATTGPSPVSKTWCATTT